jgi:hypothetical protein
MLTFLRRLLGLSSPIPPPDDTDELLPEPTGLQQLQEIEQLLDRENENRPARPQARPAPVIHLDEERWRRSSAPGS